MFVTKNPRLLAGVFFGVTFFFNVDIELRADTWVRPYRHSNMSIKPTSGIPGNLPPVTPSGENAPTQKATPAQNIVNPEAVKEGGKKQLEEDLKAFGDKWKKMLIAGGIFTSGGDGILFPQNLLDPYNPANDPKYMHLLSAILSMKEQKKKFMTKKQIEEEEEDDSWGEES